MNNKKKIKKYVLLYQEENLVINNQYSLEEIWHKILSAGKVPDPDMIVLPDGSELKYIPYLFHQCFDHGRITEKELLVLT